MFFLASNVYTLPGMLGKTVQSGKTQAPCYTVTGRSKIGSFHEDLQKVSFRSESIDQTSSIRNLKVVKQTCQTEIDRLFSVRYKPFQMKPTKIIFLKRIIIIIINFIIIVLKNICIVWIIILIIKSYFYKLIVKITFCKNL